MCFKYCQESVLLQSVTLKQYIYFDIFYPCLGLDPDDYESEEKSDKIKNPNSIQSGKWQLGFQGEESSLLS